MKRVSCIILVLVLSVILGCAKKEKAAVKIGTIEITAKEFDEGFKVSNFANDKEKGRGEFLENLINRKLILKEAENEGVNKNPEFLKSIQLFWEQSLLKLMLDKKSKELFANIKVTDEEIRNFYEKNKEKSFLNKDLPKVYEAIKLLMFRQKEKISLQNWLNSLQKKTKINIDYKLLGIK